MADPVSPYTDPRTIALAELNLSPGTNIIGELSTRAAAIAALFAARGAPLAAQAGEMVDAADRWGIDWRLIPTIAILESGGGVQACRDDPENAYGYASCEGVDFTSPADAIETVAMTLAGGPYAGLDALSRLCVWVGGSRCTTEHELAYRDRGAGLFDALRQD